MFAFLVPSQLSPVRLRVFSGRRLFEYYILTMARFSIRQKTPSARVAAQPSDTGCNVRVRRNPVRLQSPRTPIPPHSDSVVSGVASSVSSAAALNVAPDPGAATQTSAAGSNARARPTPVRRQPTGLHYLPPRPLLSPTLRRQFLLPPP